MSGAESFDEDEEEILFVPKGKPATQSQSNLPSSSLSSSVSQKETAHSKTGSVFDAPELQAALPHVVPREMGVAKRRILVVLDLNGILLFRERIDQTPEGVIPHATVGTFNVWDRQHATSFLDFMFSTFDVGVWSSARQENVINLVKRAFGAKRMKKLLFMWDQSYCTIENRKPRPLFAKELEKVWMAFPQYSRQNTILIDDDKEKAKHNPPFSGIHPVEWTRHSPQDDKLAACGIIRQYLETMNYEHQRNPSFTMEKYIRENPFVEKL